LGRGREKTTWRNPYMVLIKVLIFTGLRNAELTRIRLQDVDLD
jgi:integrase